MISIVILLSVANIISLVIMFKIFANNVKLQKECSDYRTKSDKLKSEQNKLEIAKKDLISIEPGDRAIMPNVSLHFTEGSDSGKGFRITYELEIIEASLDKVKVKAIDFTSDDKLGNDPSNRKSIIDFMKDKWVPKGDIDMIIDDSKRRDIKIEEILKK